MELLDTFKGGGLLDKILYTRIHQGILAKHGCIMRHLFFRRRTASGYEIQKYQLDGADDADDRY